MIAIEFQFVVESLMETLSQFDLAGDHVRASYDNKDSFYTIERTTNSCRPGSKYVS